jgi:hypothetical protein
MIAEPGGLDGGRLYSASPTRRPLFYLRWPTSACSCRPRERVGQLLVPDRTGTPRRHQLCRLDGPCDM